MPQFLLDFHNSNKQVEVLNIAIQSKIIQQKIIDSVATLKQLKIRDNIQFKILNYKTIMNIDMRLKLSRRDCQEKALTIQIVENKKIKNALSYIINLEDHTIGDLIRISLLKDEEIMFAGYKVSHPLQDLLQIKIQTNSIPPNEVMIKNLKLLQKQLVQLEDQFDEITTNVKFNQLQ